MCLRVEEVSCSGHNDSTLPGEMNRMSNRCSANIAYPQTGSRICLLLGSLVARTHRVKETTSVIGNDFRQDAFAVHAYAVQAVAKI